MSDITVEYFEFDEPRPLNPEEQKLEDWYTAYLKRSQANARYTCSMCGLFVSKEQAMTCLNGYPGDEIWCPPGKGCNR